MNNKQRLLLSGDEERSLTSLKAILETQYEVDIVIGSYEVIKSLKRTEYHCLLLDFNGKKDALNGTLEYIKSMKLYEQLPILILSTGDDINQNDREFIQSNMEIVSRSYEDTVILIKISYYINYYAHNKKIRDYERLLTIDSATGLLRRRGFEKRVKECIANKIAGGMLFVDIDGLKYVNDTLGHLEGDRLICDFGRALRSQLGQGDFGGHLSGDEFAIFLTSAKNAEDCKNWAKRFLETVEKTVIIKDNQRIMTASIGISLFPQQADSFAGLINNADKALLYVKNHGKNGYRIYDKRDVTMTKVLGRQESTFSSLPILLQGRKNEETQLWVKFGEFRLMWSSGKKVERESGIAHLTAGLFTIRAKDTNQLTTQRANDIADEVIRHLKDNKTEGIFCRYSINEFLMLAFYKEETDQVIAELQDSMQKVLKEEEQITTEILL